MTYRFIKSLSFASIVAVAALSLLVLSSCNDDDDDNPNVPVPSNNIANIGVADFPTSFNGGDPRGTYFPNAPFHVFRPGANVNIEDNGIRGNFRLVLSGSSATSGQAELICDTLVIAHKATYSTGNTHVSSENRDAFTSSSGIRTTGLWTVEGNELSIIVENFVLQTSKFAVTPRGLFLRYQVLWVGAPDSYIDFALKKQ